MRGHERVNRRRLRAAQRIDHVLELDSAPACVCVTGRPRPDDNSSTPRLGREGDTVIRKLASGGYRLYSKKTDPKTGKRKNLGTFKTRAAAEKHERAVQFFKRRG
jgi:hypothetical protein